MLSSFRSLIIRLAWVLVWLFLFRDENGDPFPFIILLIKDAYFFIALILFSVVCFVNTLVEGVLGVFDLSIYLFGAPIECLF